MSDDNTPNAPIAPIARDSRGINPYGADPNDIEDWQTAYQKGIDALAHRYDQPNWFQIAAGFAKPQLGGFLSSLGSASQAYGQQVEKQRDTQAQVEQMKANLAQSNISLGQNRQAANIVANAGGTLSPLDQQRVAALTGGAEAGAKAGAIAQQNVAANTAQILSTAGTWAEVTAKLGPQALSIVKQVIADNPNIKLPSDTPPEIRSTSSVNPSDNTGPVTTGSGANNQTLIIPGVPSAVSKGLTREQEINIANKQIGDRLTRRDELYSSLGTTAAQSIPVFNSARTVYELAADPLLKPAFAVFENGDPASIIGKGLEDQEVSNLLKQMRTQIINSTLSDGDKNIALTKFQTLQGALGDLNTKLMTSFPNQTDLRSAIEGASIPDRKDTQDAFLRGIARISSNALTQHDIYDAYTKFMKQPGVDVYDWVKSPEYKEVMNQSHRRGLAAQSQPASQELPLWMQKGFNKESESLSRVFDGKTYVRQGKSYVLQGGSQ